MTQHTQRPPTPDATCKDCGGGGLGWWVGRHKHPGAAGPRCHPCYLRYTRRRQTPGSNGDKRVRTTGLPAPDFPCSDCGALFRRKNAGTRCVACSLARRCRAEALRRDAEQSGDKGIHWTVVGERDGWRCHICGHKVPKIAGTAANARGATVDHLVPIAEHGTHTWDNVALAHRTCNTVRGAGGTAQLRLVG